MRTLNLLDIFLYKEKTDNKNYILIKYHQNIESCTL